VDGADLQAVAGLQLLVEFAGRAGDVHAARDAAFAVFDALDDARGLGALRTVGALGGVHHFFAVAGLGNLGHGLLPESDVGALVMGARRPRVFAKSHLICAGSSEKSGGARWFNFTRRKYRSSGERVMRITEGSEDAG